MRKNICVYCASSQRCDALSQSHGLVVLPGGCGTFEFGQLN